MNKVAITTAAIVAAVGYSNAYADVTGASTTLAKNIVQECNIGLLAPPHDGSIGDPVNQVGGQYVHSELNDLTVSGQSISGKALCNASGGYDIHVTATNGSLNNNDNTGSKNVNYLLKKGNFDKLTGGDFDSPKDLAAGESALVATGSTTEIASFQLIMNLAPGEAFSYAGQYTETLTFDLTPL